MGQFTNEDQMQAACITWFQNTYIDLRGRLFAVQNNSENIVRGSNRKAKGVRAGVSDLVLIVNRRVYFIELKTETGKQSPDQEIFEQLVNVEGFDYYIVRSLESFQKIINTIINGDETKLLSYVKNNYGRK